jgi:hypothetical protein
MRSFPVVLNKGRRFRLMVRALLAALLVCLLGLTGLSPAVAGPAGGSTTAGTANLMIASNIVVDAVPNPAYIGRDVSVTATISEISGNPFPATGSVTFLDGTTVLGSAPLVGQSATWTGQFLEGTHSLTATYGGDASYLPGTSGAFSLPVLQAGPTLAITMAGNPDPAYVWTDGSTADVGVAATSPVGSYDYPLTRYNLLLSGLSGALPADVHLQQLIDSTWTDVVLTSSADGLIATIGKPAGTELPSGATITNPLRISMRTGAPTGDLTMTMALVNSTDGGATFPTVLATQAKVLTVSRLLTATVVTAASVLTNENSAPVTMKANVTPVAATGTVTFTDFGAGSAGGSGTVVGVANVTGGAATSTARLVLGSHQIFATYSGDSRLYGTSTSTVPATPTVTPAGGAIHPLTPFRILDTRNGVGVIKKGAIPANGKLTIQVAGKGGVPSGNVEAGVINMTIRTNTKAGYMTMYAAGSPVPAVASLSFDANIITAGLVIVPVSADGKVTIYNRSPGPINLLADVSGYFANQLTSLSRGGRYNGFSPFRLVDNTKTRMKPNAAVTVKITGRTSGSSRIPTTGVGAVMLNITDFNPSAYGYLTAYPNGAKVPNTSVLNFPKGLTRSNRVILAVGTNGSVVIKNSGLSTVGIYVEVAGYFTSDTNPAGGTTYVPLPVAKRLTYAQWGNNQAKFITIAGAGGIPSRTAIVPPVGFIANITARAITATTYLEMYPSGVRPASVDVVITRGHTTSNLTIAQIAAGRVALYNNKGNTVITVDAFGWFG